jgi:hypothetical protein
VADEDETETETFEELTGELLEAVTISPLTVHVDVAELLAADLTVAQVLELVAGLKDVLL